MSDGVRICVLGDELVAGQGDARALGWVGRVLARTRHEVDPFVAALPVPGETSTNLAARWESETASRFDALDDNRLVIGLSASDVTSGVSTARSRLNLANVLDAASASDVRTFVVGPPPRLRVDERALGTVSDAFADVCRRRHVPYVETFEPLRSHEQWLADMYGGNGVVPGQAGYGLLAWLVLHEGWHGWLGAEDRAA
ncbi:GDSL-type esterase/lipase family protein [Georgenia sp. Z1344]|uniref:GDSL-type esterase/lipase family protein n=1 Tax=Georgenia sp. Z1344 TaxID=3416706 RepID=UPI003CEC4AED